jgi:hypothetical protein
MESLRSAVGWLHVVIVAVAVVGSWYLETEVFPGLRRPDPVAGSAERTIGAEAHSGGDMGGDLRRQ